MKTAHAAALLALLGLVTLIQPPERFRGAEMLFGLGFGTLFLAIAASAALVGLGSIFSEALRRNWLRAVVIAAWSIAVALGLMVWLVPPAVRHLLQHDADTANGAVLTPASAAVASEPVGAASQAASRGPCDGVKPPSPGAFLNEHMATHVVYADVQDPDNALYRLMWEHPKSFDYGGALKACVTSEQILRFLAEDQKVEGTRRHEPIRPKRGQRRPLRDLLPPQHVVDTARYQFREAEKAGASDAAIVLYLMSGGMLHQDELASAAAAGYSALEVVRYLEIANQSAGQK